MVSHPSQTALGVDVVAGRAYDSGGRRQRHEGPQTGFRQGRRLCRRRRRRRSRSRGLRCSNARLTGLDVRDRDALCISAVEVRRGTYRIGTRFGVSVRPGDGGP